MLTPKEAAKKALEVQDGVNPRGIARLLVEVIDSACAHNGGTKGASGDSAVYLVMDKLASLGLYPQNFAVGSYSVHYSRCHQQGILLDCEAVKEGSESE